MKKLKKNQVKLPPLDCEWGFYFETVNNFLNSLNLDPNLFWKWMEGQTGTIDPKNNKMVVYECDLSAYVNVAGPKTPIYD